MRFTRFDQLSAPAPPPGYGLRRYHPGDEEAWIGLLSTGDFGTWDRARLERMLAGERAPLPLEGVFFATHQDQPIGAACTFLYNDQRQNAAELGWVVVHPRHRGRGLGLPICQAALGFIHELGYVSAFLLTEDFRLPAIRLYLRLGFEPEMIDPSHPAWWAALRRRLAAGDRSD
jgi:mycothiol synthase